MKTKTDHSDFLKDYQNSRKVREKPVDLRNEQLVTQVFESQKKVIPEETAIFENIVKIPGEEGYNGHPQGISTGRMLLPKLFNAKGTNY